MKISFNGIYLYKLPNKIQRDNLVRRIKVHENTEKNLWLAFDINQKNSYDAILLTGKDLTEYRALSILKPMGTIDKYMQTVLSGYSQKATVFDFTK